MVEGSEIGRAIIPFAEGGISRTKQVPGTAYGECDVFCGTAGAVDRETIKYYVESQGNEEEKYLVMVDD